MTFPGTRAWRQVGWVGGIQQATRPLAYTLMLVAFGWLSPFMVGGISSAPITVAHADNGATLSLIQPVDPEGPVGANIVARIQNADKNATFQLAYPASGADCTTTPLTPISGVSANTTNDSGNRTFTFVWPAASGTGTFVLCAQLGDSGGTMLQSDKPYTVLAATAPTISVAPVETATPTTSGGGTIEITPGVTPTYTVDTQITVTGTGFLPGGTQIGVWESGVQTAHNATDLGTQLQVMSGDRHTDTNGNFSLVVTLAAGRIDQAYIHVATSDGSNTLPPTLDVSQLITIGQAAPTPTVTVTATNTPHPRLTPTPPSQGNGAGVGAGRILAISGLGSLSVLLLVIGTMLLVSAGRRP